MLTNVCFVLFFKFFRHKKQILRQKSAINQLNWFLFECSVRVQDAVSYLNRKSPNVPNALASLLITTNNVEFNDEISKIQHILEQQALNDNHLQKKLQQLMLDQTGDKSLVKYFPALQECLDLSFIPPNTTSLPAKQNLHDSRREAGLRCQKAALLKKWRSSKAYAKIKMEMEEHAYKNKLPISVIDPDPPEGFIEDLAEESTTSKPLSTDTINIKKIEISNDSDVDQQLVIDQEVAKIHRWVARGLAFNPLAATFGLDKEMLEDKAEESNIKTVVTNETTINNLNESDKADNSFVTSLFGNLFNPTSQNKPVSAIHQKEDNAYTEMPLGRSKSKLSCHISTLADMNTEMSFRYNANKKTPSSPTRKPLKDLQSSINRLHTSSDKKWKTPHKHSQFSSNLISPNSSSRKQLKVHTILSDSSEIKTIREKKNYSQSAEQKQFSRSSSNRTNEVKQRRPSLLDTAPIVHWSETATARSLFKAGGEVSFVTLEVLQERWRRWRAGKGLIIEDDVLQHEKEFEMFHDFWIFEEKFSEGFGFKPCTLQFGSQFLKIRSNPANSPSKNQYSPNGKKIFHGRRLIDINYLQIMHISPQDPIISSDDPHTQNHWRIVDFLMEGGEVITLKFLSDDLMNIVVNELSCRLGLISLEPSVFSSKLRNMLTSFPNILLQRQNDTLNGLYGNGNQQSPLNMINAKEIQLKSSNQMDLPNSETQSFAKNIEESTVHEVTNLRTELDLTKERFNVRIAKLKSVIRQREALKANLEINKIIVSISNSEQNDVSKGMNDLTSEFLKFDEKSNLETQQLKNENKTLRNGIDSAILAQKDEKKASNFTVTRLQKVRNQLNDVIEEITQVNRTVLSEVDYLSQRLMTLKTEIDPIIYAEVTSALGTNLTNRKDHIQERFNIISTEQCENTDLIYRKKLVLIDPLLDLI